MEVNGKVYLLDKAAGVTSRRAALAVAKANGFKKYGHCGTLDPDATGLLVVLLGKATRLAPYISGEVKMQPGIASGLTFLVPSPDKMQIR